MQKSPIYFSLTFSLLFSFCLHAQHDLNSTFISESWISTFNNPAMTPKKKIHIGLPTFYVSTSVDAPKLKSIVDVSEGTIDWAALEEKVGDEIYLGEDLVVHPLYFSMALGDFRFGVEYSVVQRSSLTLPGDMVRFIAYGNKPYSDRALDLAPQIYNVAYQSIAFPFSVEKEKWTFGIRPAMLMGIASFSMKKTRADLTTDVTTGNMFLEGEVEVVGSSLIDLDVTNDLGINFNEDFLQNGFSFRHNMGFNIDLGARYKATDNLTLGASIKGLGQIKWDKQVVKYEASGASTITGFEFNGLANDDNFEIDEDADGWIENFETSTVVGETFMTPLAKNIFLTGQYKINGLFEAGAVLYGELLDGRFDPAFALHGRVHAGKWLAFGLTYGMRQNKWTHLGANLLVQAGPAQLFLASDNVLTAFNPALNNSSNARFGLALAFGK